MDRFEAPARHGQPAPRCQHPARAFPAPRQALPRLGMPSYQSQKQKKRRREEEEEEEEKMKKKSLEHGLCHRSAVESLSYGHGRGGGGLAPPGVRPPPMSTRSTLLISPSSSCLSLFLSALSLSSPCARRAARPACSAMVGNLEGGGAAAAPTHARGGRGWIRGSLHLAPAAEVAGRLAGSAPGRCQPWPLAAVQRCFAEIVCEGGMRKEKN